MPNRKKLGRELSKIEEMRSMLDRIEEVQACSDLSDWEDDFLESIYDQVENGHRLNDNQLDKLEEIETERLA